MQTTQDTVLTEDEKKIFNELLDAVDQTTNKIIARKTAEVKKNGGDILDRCLILCSNLLQNDPDSQLDRNDKVVDEVEGFANKAVTIKQKTRKLRK
jgi:negative regulator of replication initiation